MSPSPQRGGNNEVMKLPPSPDGEGGGGISSHDVEDVENRLQIKVEPFDLNATELQQENGTSPSKATDADQDKGFLWEQEVKPQIDSDGKVIVGRPAVSPSSTPTKVQKRQRNKRTTAKSDANGGEEDNNNNNTDVNPKKKRRRIIIDESNDSSSGSTGSKDRLANKKNKSKEKSSYPCKLCDQSFTFIGNLHRHERRYHSGNTKGRKDSSSSSSKATKWTCDVCSESFDTEGQWRAHVRRIHQHLLWHCKKCSKTFSKQSDLENHDEKIHKKLEEKSESCFECAICGKKFATNQHLMSHVRFHDSDKPFKCSKCSKAFVQKRQLQQHTANQHNGEKPFKCTICSMSFLFEAVLLREHMPLHSDVRPFPCSTCRKGFKTKKHMLKHERYFCAIAKAQVASKDSVKETKTRQSRRTKSVSKESTNIKGKNHAATSVRENCDFVDLEKLNEEDEERECYS